MDTVRHSNIQFDSLFDIHFNIQFAVIFAFARMPKEMHFFCEEFSKNEENRTSSFKIAS